MEGVDNFIMKDGGYRNVKSGQGGEDDVKVWSVCVDGGGIIPAVVVVSLSHRVQCPKQFQYHVRDLRLKRFDPPPSSPHLQTDRQRNRGRERERDEESV